MKRRRFEFEDRESVVRFLESSADRHTMGLVYGRRRIGKSTLLEHLTVERGGFYWEATRTERTVQLARLGTSLGEHLGTGPLALESWEDAIDRLLHLGADRSVLVVVDELGYVVEADPGIASVIASALGPAGQRRNPGRARLVLCGSAIGAMHALTSGQAPLRGRAGMELVMQPAGYRDAAVWLGRDPRLQLAVRVYAIIGGVIGYATDMVDHDLPRSLADLDRWVCDRILSPASPLHHEATTLLAEEPTLSGASPMLHHGILGAIANGSVTAGTISRRLGRPVSNLDPSLKRLIAAGFVIRHADPIRDQRPTYTLADPFLQFHYAILDPHGSRLRDANIRQVWRHLAATFDSRVRGPVFEEQARVWVRRHAAPATLGGIPSHIGPSVVSIKGSERQLDVVAAVADPADAPPADRQVLAIGEAKAGETPGLRHLEALGRARSALGVRAASAKLLLIAPSFDPRLIEAATNRPDVELVDLERLYRGS